MLIVPRWRRLVPVHEPEKVTAMKSKGAPAGTRGRHRKGTNKRNNMAARGNVIPLAMFLPSQGNHRPPPVVPFSNPPLRTDRPQDGGAPRLREFTTPSLVKASLDVRP
jgi:hypothetical protein